MNTFSAAVNCAKRAVIIPTSRLARVSAFALLGISALVTACKSAAEPDGDWLISGPVVAREIRISIGDPPSIHVKENSADECGIIFLVRPSTQIRRRTNSGAIVRASYAELVLGKNVRVWARYVLESCPGQSSAEIVEIEL